jgi:simple sugar transport system permease protein
MPDSTLEASSNPPLTTDEPTGSVQTPRRIKLARLRDFALVPAIILIAIIGEWVNPVFLHLTNIVTILQPTSEVGLMVLAETLVLIMARIDLSLESTFGLAPGIAAWLTVAPGINHGLGLVPGEFAVPICLGVGVAVGIVNGLLIVRFRLNGFIVTLGMLIVLRGLLTGISGGRTFFDLPPSMTYLSQTFWLKVPVAVWLSLALFALAMFVMAYTRAGRALYAIGGNVAAAKAAGIRADRIVWITLIVASVLAALGGLMLTGQLGSVPASQGQGYIFTVFASAVIGGVSLNGGKGTMFGAFTGVLLLYMIQNVLTLANISAQWIDFLNGMIILTALIVSRVTTGQEQE